VAVKLPARRGFRLMGVVNVTPDSFSDGGRYLQAEAAIAHGEQLLDEGADIIDVGGESTRPGADPVSAEEELERVAPVIEGLARRHPGAAISIDTSKAAVARAALAAGARLVNDVSALRADPQMVGLVAAGGADCVLMHMQGEPRTMQADPRYDDVVAQVGDFLADRIEVARAAGVAEGALAADPGIGFGKTVEHNLRLLAGLPALAERVGVPVLVGTSRKTFVGKVLARAGAASGDLPVDQREEGTLATVVWAVERGASIVRVHDVLPAVRVVRLLDAVHSADASAA
jgi:dihydropteroate synthase